jgi:hypothetical protein
MCQAPDGTDDVKKGSQLLEVRHDVADFCFKHMRVIWDAKWEKMQGFTLSRTAHTIAGGAINPSMPYCYCTGPTQVYAMEIQMATEQRNNKRLKQLYHAALGVRRYASCR